MRRVTKAGGVVATTMWDGSPANKLNGCLWETAIALDPIVKRPSERRGAYSSAEALTALWEGAGLTHIEVNDLTIECPFASFDDLWRRYLTGEGPGGVYVVGLPEDCRELLRQQLRQDVLGGGADRSFMLQAKAWAVRGVAP